MACSSRHRRWCNPDHEWIVTTYRDARDAHDAHAGTNHQLEPDELAQLPSSVTFKDWLVRWSGRNREQVTA